MLRASSSYTAHQAIDALIRYKGDADAAAEYLGTAREDLMQLVVGNPASHDQLNSVLRMQTLLSAFEMLGLVQRVFVECLPDLSPHVVAKTYISLLETIGRMNQAPAPAQSAAADPRAMLMRLLPPDIRDSLTVLIDEGGGADADSASELVTIPSRAVDS